MKLTGLFLILIFLVPTIFAECNEGQIDINSASKTELEKLAGIGPVKADAIINYRPFDCLDDLVKVYGIGEITLENIKTQGLACVENEKQKEDEEIEEDLEETNENISEEKIEENTERIEENKIISLTPKDIKSYEDVDNSSKTYLIYFFVFICILLIVLFLKFRKHKDELE